jgi:hypothetical protein
VSIKGTWKETSRPVRTSRHSATTGPRRWRPIDGAAIGVLIFIGSYYFDTATNRGVALKLRFSDSVQGVAVYCCRIHGYISEKK